MSILEEHREVYKALNRNRVKYLVIGGIAVMAHGIPRFTLDLDILIEPTLENCRKTLKALKEAGLKRAGKLAPEVILEATMYSIVDYINVDIQAGARMTDFNDMWERRAIKYLRNVKINVISIEDLIETKKYLDRPKDLEDIEMLKKILRGEI
ncbi:hypothetical protein KAW65_06735 [candidate division WOR-3 bacterium]|nr:hypothetical protein [candidate division WOR-3 bacterium]